MFKKTAFTFVTVAWVIMIHTVAFGASTTDSMLEQFKTPSNDTHPFVYWYWMNGNVSKEGALADIDAMHEVGVGGVFLMDVGLHPQGPVLYRSEAWWDIVVAVAKRCAEYDMKITFNCPGWALAGGPWITPELNMQEVTWSETRVPGAKKVKMRLPKPEHKLSTYSDIATIAFPSCSGDTGNLLLDAKLYDARGKQLADWKAIATQTNSDRVHLPPTFDAVFKTPVKARHVYCTSADEYRRIDMDLYAWDESTRDWKKITHLYSKSGAFSYQVAADSFEAVESTRFRFDFLQQRERPQNIFQLKLTSDYRVPDWANKAGFSCDNDIGAKPDYTLRTDDVIAMKDIVTLSDKMDRHGKLVWKTPKLPKGQTWTILRMGYTPTGKKTNPHLFGIVPYEADKMSKEAAKAHFDGMWNPVFERLGEALSKKVLFSNHIDSYEAGWQNWTPKMPEEFMARKGYDLLNFLPALTGRVVEGPIKNEGFLWDFRRTISDMYGDNFYGEVSRLTHEAGLALSSETYGGPFEHLYLGTQVDYPMVECWFPANTGSKYYSDPIFAGRTMGAARIGYEAFTSGTPADRFTAHPGILKTQGDMILASGVNWFVLHVYAQQPSLDPHLMPGFTCGQNGIHFDRGNTWFFKSRPWVEYLSRCSYMLRQGQPFADVLYYTGDKPYGESGPYEPRAPRGYEFDVITSKQLPGLTVKDGKVILPNGKSYALLIYAHESTDSLVSLENLLRLTKAGASVIAMQPTYNPSLIEQKTRPADFAKLSETLWSGLSEAKGKKSMGSGTLYKGYSVQDVMNELSLKPDFACTEGSELQLMHTHRRTGDADIYFVANVTYNSGWMDCAFRVTGKTPEIWNAETGEVEAWPMFIDDGVTTAIPFHFASAESKFVVFKDKQTSAPAIKALKHNGELLTGVTVKGTEESTGNFTLAAMVVPAVDIELMEEKTSGVQIFNNKQNWVMYPGQGEQAYGKGHSGIGLSVGRNGIAVFEHWSFNAPAILVWKADRVMIDSINIAVICENNEVSLYVNGKRVKKARKTGNQIHAFYQVDKKAYQGVISTAKTIHAVLPADMLLVGGDALFAPAEESLEVSFDETDAGLMMTASEEGEFEITWQDGTTKTCAVSAPMTQAIDGAWNVNFPAGWGAPEQVVFPELIAWNKHEEPGINYFSGTATYTKAIEIPDAFLKEGRRIVIDLGRVEIIAHVTVNGKDMGILWKTPFEMDITDAVKAGKNELSVEIVNQWPNRLIGDEQYPDDVKKGGKWLSRELPSNYADWLRNGEPRPEKRRLTFTAWKHFTADDPLHPSGLIGPVVLESREYFKINEAEPFKIAHLRCEYLENPLGIDVVKPRLSWIMESNERGQKQTAYRVLVASSRENLKKDMGDLWDTGKVDSDQSIQLVYKGKALTSRMQCFWKVMVWPALSEAEGDKEGNPSAWSESAMWSMGLLDPEDWAAKWITHPASERLSYPWLRRTFEVKEDVEQAVIHVNTPSFYELRINGKKVSPYVLTPGISKLDTRFLVNSYDVTSYLVKGSNCIALWMGPGWHQPRNGNKYNAPILRAQLDIQTPSGLTLIGTDSSWRVKESCISQIGEWKWNNFGGEHYDARNFVSGWDQAGLDDSNWLAAREIDAPNVVHSWQGCESARPSAPISPNKISQLDNGKWVIDFGRPLTGWMRLNMHKLKAGQEVHIDYADVNDNDNERKLSHKPGPDGFQTFNQKDVFISAGKGKETFCSRFNYHSFRHVVIAGLSQKPAIEDAVAMMIEPELDSAGSFECSNDLLNQIHEITRYTLRTQNPCLALGTGEAREKSAYGDGGAHLSGYLYNLKFVRSFTKRFTCRVKGRTPLATRVL